MSPARDGSGLIQDILALFMCRLRKKGMFKTWHEPRRTAATFPSDHGPLEDLGVYLMLGTGFK